MRRRLAEAPGEPCGIPRGNGVLARALRPLPGRSGKPEFLGWPLEEVIGNPPPLTRCKPLIRQEKKGYPGGNPR